MEHLLFKAVFLAGMFLVWVVRRLRAAAEQPAPSAMVAPPPLPRRARPRARAVAVAKPAPTASAPAAVPSPAPSAAPLVVARRTRGAVRAEFRGRGALRRAFIAQEVLGPPLALRPPRF